MRERFKSITSRELFLLVALLVAAQAGPARAQTRSPRRPAELAHIRYEAPAGCPRREALEERIRARTRSHSLETDARRGPRELRIYVHTTKGTAMGRIDIHGVDGGITTRQIEAASCDEVVDGLALIAALTLDSTQPRASLRAEPSPPRTREAPTAMPEPRTLKLEFSTAALAASGVAPEVSSGIQPAAGLTSVAILGGTGLRAGLRFVTHRTVRHDEGTATFDWWAAVMALCSNLLSTNSSALAACVVFEHGRLQSTGGETRNPSSTERPWSALGPGVTGDWIVLSPLWLRGGIEGVLPLVRDRFLLGDAVVYRIPFVAARAHVALGVSF